MEAQGRKLLSQSWEACEDFMKEGALNLDIEEKAQLVVKGKESR